MVYLIHFWSILVYISLFWSILCILIGFGLFWKSRSILSIFGRFSLFCQLLTYSLLILNYPDIFKSLNLDRPFYNILSLLLVWIEFSICAFVRIPFHNFFLGKSCWKFCCESLQFHLHTELSYGGKNLKSENELKEASK